MERDKIFCIGLGKTGTTTFAACMKALGLRHLTGPYLEGTYMATRKDHASLIELTSAFDSLDDYPWPLIYDALHAAYPTAYFALTRRRDANAWFDSVCKHYDRYGSSETWRLIFGAYSPITDKKKFISVYEKHNAAVRAYFRGNDRFQEICWEEGDGWPEICTWLNRPDPGIALPRENTANKTDDLSLLNRLVKKGQFAHAMWYAQHKAHDPEQALSFLDERINLVAREYVHPPSRLRRVVTTLQRRIKPSSRLS